MASKEEAFCKVARTQCLAPCSSPALSSYLPSGCGWCPGPAWAVSLEGLSVVMSPRADVFKCLSLLAGPSRARSSTGVSWGFCLP